MAADAGRVIRSINEGSVDGDAGSPNTLHDESATMRPKIAGKREEGRDADTFWASTKFDDASQPKGTRLVHDKSVTRTLPVYT